MVILDALDKLIVGLVKKVDSRGEEAHLKVTTLAEAFDSAKDVFDVLFEAKLEHLIGLVKDDSLNVTEVNVASIEMVQNATCCAHENFATIFKPIYIV
jgi:hypothetical protein